MHSVPATVAFCARLIARPGPADRDVAKIARSASVPAFQQAYDKQSFDQTLAERQPCALIAAKSIPARALGRTEKWLFCTRCSCPFDRSRAVPIRHRSVIDALKVARSSVTFRHHEHEVRCCGPPLVQLGRATQRWPQALRSPLSPRTRTYSEPPDPRLLRRRRSGSFQVRGRGPDAA
jgi:hypothetical protein